MRCPGCPPSISPTPCFSWPSSAEQSSGRRKQAACVFSNELSKQELAHLLAREAQRIKQCRSSGIPYQSPLQLATKRASTGMPTTEPVTATNSISAATLIRRSGPYTPVVHRSTPMYLQQCLSPTQHPVTRESVHRRPRISYSAHTGYISSTKQDMLPEEIYNSTFTQHTHSALPYRSLFSHVDNACCADIYDYEVRGSDTIVDFYGRKPPKSAQNISRAAVSSGGKRRANLNPNGFEDGFISMPGSSRTSSVSDSCHINPRLHEPEYRQSSSSYCHFRPGLGNTYFYN